MLDYSMTIGGVDLKQEYGIIIEEINRPSCRSCVPARWNSPTGVALTTMARNGGMKYHWI